jgi:hypothetical protein
VHHNPFKHLPKFVVAHHTGRNFELDWLSLHSDAWHFSELFKRLFRGVKFTLNAFKTKCAS